MQFSEKIIGKENRPRKKKSLSLWDPAPAHNFLSRRHFYVSLHYWSTQHVIIFITEKKSEGCKMMRMSCPSFSDNVFRLAVGGRVVKWTIWVCKGWCLIYSAQSFSNIVSYKRKKKEGRFVRLPYSALRLRLRFRLTLTTFWSRLKLQLVDSLRRLIRRLA